MASSSGNYANLSLDRDTGPRVPCLGNGLVPVRSMRQHGRSCATHWPTSCPRWPPPWGWMCTIRRALRDPRLSARFGTDPCGLPRRGHRASGHRSRSGAGRNPRRRTPLRHRPALRVRLLRRPGRRRPPARPGISGVAAGTGRYRQRGGGSADRPPSRVHPPDHRRSRDDPRRYRRRPRRPPASASRRAGDRRRGPGAPHLSRGCVGAVRCARRLDRGIVHGRNGCHSRTGRGRALVRPDATQFVPLIASR